MRVTVCDNVDQLGQQAAHLGAEKIRQAIRDKGSANIILATGTSQFSTLSHLLQEPDIEWHRVVIFHLDEYLGLPPTHPASFRKFLWDRFLSKLPTCPRHFYAIDGQGADTTKECTQLGEWIRSKLIDVAFIGIGENAHLAFNDPPADFETTTPYIVVQLDEACRQQQLGEGWFATLADVPTQAISMSIQQILKSETIICSVPDQRKAVAVKRSLEGPLTNEVPASILRTHGEMYLFLDRAAAGLLTSV